MLLFVLFVLGTVGYGPKMNFSHRIKSEFYSEDNLFYDGTKMLKEPWSFIFWKQSIISDLSYLTICDTKYWEVLVTFLCLFLALLSPNSETRKGQDFVTHKKDILGKKGNKCFFFNYCISFIFFNFAKSLKLQNPFDFRMYKCIGLQLLWLDGHVLYSLEFLKALVQRCRGQL